MHRGRDGSDAATSQGTQAAMSSCQRQGPDSPLELLQGAQSCQHLDFSPVERISGFWPPELRE